MTSATTRAAKHGRPVAVLLAGQLAAPIAVSLAALIAPCPAAAHIGEGGVGASQIEVEATVTDRAVSYDLHVPTMHFLQKVLGAQSMEAFRALATEEITRKTEDFFENTNRLQVDGITVRPVLQEMLLEVPELKGVSVSEDRMAFEFGAIRCKMDFETKGSPRSVGILWQLFLGEEGGPRIGSAAPGFEDSVILQLNAGDVRRLVVLSRSEPEFIWHAEGKSRAPVRLGVEESPVEGVLRIPALGLALGVVAIVAFFWRTRARSALRTIASVALLCAGIATGMGGVGSVGLQRPLAALSDEEALEVFRSLHKNIYRAFDYTTESDIYDALARSVDGPQLEQIYTDVYSSLILRDQGGAVCRVQSVEVLESEIASPSAGVADDSHSYGVLCRWRVHGLVRHWGHTHARTNEFQALYSVAPRAGAWKIVHTEIREHERVDDAP